MSKQGTCVVMNAHELVLIGNHLLQFLECVPLEYTINKLTLPRCRSIYRVKFKLPYTRKYMYIPAIKNQYTLKRTIFSTIDEKDHYFCDCSNCGVLSSLLRSHTNIYTSE